MPGDTTHRPRQRLANPSAPSLVPNLRYERFGLDATATDSDSSTNLPSDRVPAEILQRISQEERRLRRQHRKRLAQIVVDHWLHFASKALSALRFRKRRERALALGCVRVWRGAVEASKARWLHEVVAATHRRLVLTTRAWHALAAYAERQRRYQRAHTALLWTRARRLYRCSFDALRAYVSARMRKHRRHLTAECYWQLSTLSRAVNGWRHVGQSEKAEEQRVAIALRHWAHQRLKVAMRGWLWYCRTKAEKRGRLEWADMMWHKRMRRKCLRRWRSALARWREKRAALDKGYAHLYASTLCRALRGWRLYVERKEEQRRRKDMAVVLAARHFILYMLWRGLCAWDKYLDAKRRKAEAWERAVWHARCACKEGAFRRWRRVLRWREEELAREERASWLSVQHNRRRLLRKALSRMRAYLAHRHAKKRQRQGAEKHRKRRMLRYVFWWWVEASERAKMAREVTEEAVEAQQTEVAEQWRSELVASRVLTCWEAYVTHRRERNLQRTRAEDHRRRFLLSRSLSSLRRYALSRGQKQEEQAAAEAFRAQNMKRKCLMEAWRHWFIGAARKKRADLAHAETFRRFKLLSRGFWGWRSRTKILAIRSAAVRGACEHYGLRLQGLAMAALRGHLVRRRAKAAELDERVTLLRRALGRKKRVRALAAWRVVHERMCAKALVLDRAIRHREVALCGLAMLMWRTWVTDRGRKAEKGVRADRWRDASLRRRALAGLRDRVAVARREREEGSRAVLRWSRAMQLRAFAWWRDWARRHAVKRARLERALGMYRERLQKWAAGHLLTVGLRRQSIRLQVALERQALHSISALSRVAPFARRWRYIVRKRRRERTLRSGGASAHLSAPPSTLSVPPLPSAPGAPGADEAHLRWRVEAAWRAAGLAPNPAMSAAIGRDGSGGTTATGVETMMPQRTLVGSSDGRRAVSTEGALERMAASLSVGAGLMETLPSRALPRTRPPPRRPPFTYPSLANQSASSAPSSALPRNTPPSPFPPRLDPPQAAPLTNPRWEDAECSKPFMPSSSTAFALIATPHSSAVFDHRPGSLFAMPCPPPPPATALFHSPRNSFDPGGGEAGWMGVGRGRGRGGSVSAEGERVAGIGGDEAGGKGGGGEWGRLSVAVAGTAGAELADSDAETLTWMEGMLSAYDALCADAAQCRAELALLRDGGGDGDADDDVVSGKKRLRARQLEQRCAALDLRRQVQMPTMRAISEHMRIMKAYKAPL